MPEVGQADQARFLMTRTLPGMSTRRSTTTAFFGGVAVANTGFIAAITVTGLVAEQITGSARLSGLPGAIGTFGTALGQPLFRP